MAGMCPVGLCGPDPARMVYCSQDYISLIANSLFLYLATLLQLYLFLCSKMNSPASRAPRTNGLQDLLWSTSLVLVLVQVAKMVEVLLVRPGVEALLYPVAGIEPVLVLTSWTLALIYLHSCLRENNHSALALLTGYHMYTFASHSYRLATFTHHGLTFTHLRVLLTAACVLLQGLSLLALFGLHSLHLLQRLKLRRQAIQPATSSPSCEPASPPQSSPVYKFATANILSRLSFFWLLPLLRLGYHVPLEQADLLPLPPVEQVRPGFLRLSSRLAPRRLLTPCLALHPTLLAAAAVLRVLADVMGFSGALGVQLIVGSLQAEVQAVANSTLSLPPLACRQPLDSLTLSQFLSYRMVVACLLLLATLAQGACSQLSSHLLTVTGIRVRNALQVCIYQKALHLSIGSPVPSQANGATKEQPSEHSTTTSENPDEAAVHNIDLGGVLNLAAEDTLNIREFVWNIHYMWSLPLKILCIILLVYSRLGVSAAMGAALGTLLTIPAQFLVGRSMSANNKAILECEDRRLQASTEAIHNMKTLKLNCWEDIFLKRINQARGLELKLLVKDSFYWSVMAFLASISTLLVTTLTVGIFSGIEARTFTAAELFTAVALFNQLAVALSVFPVTVPIFIKGFVSRSRLLDFLSRPEALGTAVGLDPSTEDKEDKKLEEEEANSEERDGQKYVLRFTNASFSWHHSSPPVLRDLNFSLPAGQVTMVIGSSSSGKSSLLSAVLKELRQMGGERELDHGEQYSRYALLSQSPWLLNASIKENILFGRPYKEKRYMKTIAACELQHDLDLLADGGDTEVGERGVLLSGGQRQRLCLARCLYSTAPIVLLDAPFSALDNRLSSSIMEKVMMGILRKQKRTVLMTTNNASMLSLAHYVIVLEAGRIKLQGTFDEVAHAFPEAQAKKIEAAEVLPKLNAKQRWTKLKIVTKCGMIMKDTIEKKKNYKLPVKESIQDAFVTRLGPMRPSRRRIFGVSRTDSSSQMGLHHDLILPSDETQESLGEVEGLLSNRHKQLLAKFLAKKESIKALPMEEEQENGMPSNSHILKKLQSERLKKGDDTGVGRRGSEHHQHLNNNNKAPGHHLALSPKPSLISLMHSKVMRLTSTASAISGVSGFSDDFQEDENDEALITSGEGSQEGREYGSISYNVYWQYLCAGGLRLLAMFLLLSLALQTMRVYLDYLLRDLVGTVSPGSVSTFFQVFGSLSFVVIIISYFYNILGQWIGANAREHLHEKMVRNLFLCPIELFEAYPIGRILNRLSCDMFVIDQKLPSCIQRLLLVSLICLSALAVNCIQSPMFILCAVPITAAYWWVQHFYRCSSRELQRLDSLSRAPIFSHFSDTLTGLVTIRSFRVQPKFINSLCEKIDTNTSAFLILQSGCRWLGLTLDVIGALIVFASITIALVMTEHTSDPVAPASLGLLISYSLLVPIYLAWVVKFVADLENYMNAVERVLEYTNLEHEEDPRKYPIADATFIKGKIVFDNVSLGYHLESRVVVAGLNLTIVPGEKVAVCGRSGSGKSTLVMGLMRMARRLHGKITIDGIDINQRPLGQLRRFVRVVHQDAALLSGTIRSNLDPQGQFPDTRLWEVLEQLELRDMVGLAGLEAEVEDNGGNMTAGQRQLLCLGRCLLVRPAVVVLDEATSSLDASQEKRIHQLLLTTLPNSTLVTVTHRLGGILNYDRVLVVGEGRLLEDGPPGDLLSRPMGFFSALHRQERQPI